MAVQVVANAKRPLIVVGSGAQDHATAVQNLAHKTSAGVVAFRTGHGIMLASDPLCLNMPTGHALWPECDLVIGLGTRLISPTGTC